MGKRSRFCLVLSMVLPVSPIVNECLVASVDSVHLNNIDSTYDRLQLVDTPKCDGHNDRVKSLQ